ncbi:MAG: hypothetical protein Q8R55_03625 [Candidatus Taylorbacteria bacterium]|nr:hypothetical protein [Candidatus Taylorbacteria bacterium]
MSTSKSESFWDIFKQWSEVEENKRCLLARKLGVVYISKNGDAFIPKLGVVDRGSELDGYVTIGIHLVCSGLLICSHTSIRHQVINCKNCRLRITIPRTVKTIEELGSYFKQFRYPLNKAQVELLDDILCHADGYGNQWWPGLPKGLLTSDFKRIIKEEVFNKFPGRKDVLVKISEDRVDIVPEGFSSW